MLLTDEEISQRIQQDCKLWCPTKGEFLQKVGEVVAKAADKARIEWFIKEIEKVMYNKSPKIISCKDWQAIKDKARKGE